MEFKYCKRCRVVVSPQSDHGRGKACHSSHLRCRICLKCNIVGVKSDMISHRSCTVPEGMSYDVLNNTPGLKEVFDTLSRSESYMKLSIIWNHVHIHYKWFAAPSVSISNDTVPNSLPANSQPLVPSSAHDASLMEEIRYLSRELERAQAEIQSRKLTISLFVTSFLIENI